MCKVCHEAVQSAIKRGVSEEKVMDFMWNNTPFPVGEPFPEQLKELEELQP